MRHTENPVSITGIRTMFKTADSYMENSKSERQSHLDLNEVCIEIGGGSKDFRGLLAHFLRTHILTMRDGVQLCHACHNAKCSNPRHLYWGTAKENAFDRHEFHGTWSKKRNRSRAGSEEHKERIRASLKVYYSDPVILQRQRERIFAAQKKRKCFANRPG